MVTLHSKCASSGSQWIRPRLCVERLYEDVLGALHAQAALRAVDARPGRPQRVRSRNVAHDVDSLGLLPRVSLPSREVSARPAVQDDHIDTIATAQV